MSEWSLYQRPMLRESRALSWIGRTGQVSVGVGEEEEEGEGPGMMEMMPVTVSRKESVWTGC